MKFFKSPLLVFLLGLFGLVSAAHAELPSSVTTAITVAASDVGTAGGAILGVVIAIVAFAWIRRVLN